MGDRYSFCPRPGNDEYPEACDIIEDDTGVELATTEDMHDASILVDHLNDADQGPYSFALQDGGKEKFGWVLRDRRGDDIAVVESKSDAETLLSHLNRGQ